MATYTYDHCVKVNGTVYPAGTAVEVDKIDEAAEDKKLKPAKKTKSSPVSK